MQHPLESRTEYILKEARALFRKPAIMWAGGKDSTTLLFIARQLFGRIPFPVIFLDTGYKFRETYQFIDEIEHLWKLKLIRARNESAMNDGVSPETHGRFRCCSLLKTENLKSIITEHGFDAVIVAIRWDEHGVRGKESVFSKRRNPDHTRIHPLLHWNEDHLWRYIRKNSIPCNPLYDRDVNGRVYRSIGCYPCTKPVPRKGAGERSGRSQDKEEIMEQLRALGYL